MNSTTRKLIAGLTVLGLVVVSCGGNDGDSASKTTEAPTDVVESKQDIGWALEYTGGTSAVAEGDPIKIGYVNSEDVFPESTVGVEAAVAFVNEALGGVGGRPLEIVPCSITQASDGAKCGIELAENEDVAAVLTGTIVEGNADLYAALNGVKPVIIGNAVTMDDFSTTAGHSFMSGTPGIITGMAGFVSTQLDAVAKVAFVANLDDWGRTAADVLFEPVVKKLGIGYSFVGIDNDATAQDVESAVASIRDDDVDVVVLALTVDQCINFYDAIRTLEIDPVVVSTFLCAGTEMSEHLRTKEIDTPVPNGWYFAGYGYSYFLPDVASGMDSYLRRIQESAPSTSTSVLAYRGFAGPGFANILTVAKIINALGTDSLDFDSLTESIKGFPGPMMLQAGPLKCGEQTFASLDNSIALCSSQMGVQQFKDDSWLSLKDGLNGQAIDASTL